MQDNGTAFLSTVTRRLRDESRNASPSNSNIIGTLARVGDTRAVVPDIVHTVSQRSQVTLGESK